MREDSNQFKIFISRLMGNIYNIVQQKVWSESKIEQEVKWVVKKSEKTVNVKQNKKYPLI